MSRFPRVRPRFPARTTRLKLTGLALLVLSSGGGCGREFFRQWADQDATEAIFQKSRDPRWQLPLFTVEPPAMSRFAEPWDPDRPPAPPDDPAAEALSPVPQMPHIRLLTPAEGDGYNDMMENGTRYEAPPPEEVQIKMNEARGIGEDGSTPPPPPGPHQAPLAAPEPTTPEPATELPEPGANPVNPEENLGTVPEPLSPNTNGDVAPPAAPAPPSGAATSPPQTRLSPQSKRDSGVQQAAFQAPASPENTGRASGTQAPASPENTGRASGTQADFSEVPVEVRSAGEGEVTAPDGTPVPPIIEDEDVPAEVDINEKPIGQPDITPEELAEVNRTRASFASVLTPAFVEFNLATTTGLPADSRPYVINPAQALQLALINSRVYQYRIENIYLQSLGLTLQRFNFQPQFYAGMSPPTSTAGGPPQGGGPNRYVYRTKEFPGGPFSNLALSEVAGFGKLLSFGGQLVMGFANQMVFNFTGVKSIQPTVNSTLPLSFVQPFLRGGGRAVTLEPLTLAERTLLYEIRAFARFRQEFFVSILSSTGLGQVIDTAGGIGGGGGDPSVGYLTVLANFQLAENYRRVVAAYQRSFEIYSEYARGGASSGISQLQVDQIDLSLQQQQQNRITQEILYQNSLDQFKQQLGIPPDVPLIIDLAPIQGFRNVFEALDAWMREEGHDPEDLPGILSRLPELPNLELDGRKLFDMTGEKPQEAWAEPERREMFLLTGERIALANRLDLMNQRAALYDVWRQIAVSANALLPVFNVALANTIATPPTTTNPFAFVSQAKQFQVTLQAELPLIRVNERNVFRGNLVAYQRQRRLLMQAEDSIKYTVRSEIRTLIQLMETYQIAIQNLQLSLRLRDQSLQQIIAPPDAGAAGGGANIANQATQTLNYINAITNVVGQLNSLVSQWVTYQTARLALYRDLGIMPYDEWEAYYELFPAATGQPTPAIGVRGGAAGAAAGAQPAAAVQP